MKQHGIKDVEDFETFDLITQEIVQKKSIELLNRLLDENDELIIKICQQLVPSSQEDIPTDKGEENIMFNAPYK
jgi:hypothetical protein